MSHLGRRPLPHEPLKRRLQRHHAPGDGVKLQARLVQTLFDFVQAALEPVDSSDVRFPGDRDFHLGEGRREGVQFCIQADEQIVIVHGWRLWGHGNDSFRDPSGSGGRGLLGGLFGGDDLDGCFEPSQNEAECVGAFLGVDKFRSDGCPEGGDTVQNALEFRHGVWFFLFELK